MTPAPTAPATRIIVTLNGSDTNPWARYGLRHNPFPQIARAERSAQAANAVLWALDGDPIRDEADLRARMDGCDPEFVAGCVERWRAHPGKRIRFAITFPTPDSWR